MDALNDLSHRVNVDLLGLHGINSDEIFLTLLFTGRFNSAVPID